MDQILLETVFSIAICRHSGDKWQSKTLFLTIFDLRSSIVITCSVVAYLVCYLMLTISRRTLHEKATKTQETSQKESYKRPANPTLPLTWTKTKICLCRLATGLKNNSLIFSVKVRNYLALLDSKSTFNTKCGFSMGRNQYWAGRVYDLCVYYMTGTPEGSTDLG